MILCSCMAVRRDAIAATILAGASSVEQIAERCGAGSQCGGCVELIEEMLSLGTRSADVVTHSAA
jgi:bacterioferritin-associated ferredoxin